MGRYGIDNVDIEDCRPTKKEYKRQLKQAEEDLETFIRLAQRMNIQWEMKQQVIGNQYLVIQDLKAHIKRNNK